MALIDVDALLAPVTDDDPTGPDLDGTDARFAIEEPFALASADDGEPGEPIDWRGVIRRTMAQSAETKDLWLAVYLTRAGAKAGDLEVVEGGARYFAGLLERYWDSVHPRLEEVDFIGRKGPAEALTKIRDFLGPLRGTVLIEHPRLGRYTAEDLDRFARDGADADGYGMFRAALGDIDTADIQLVVDRLDSIRDAVRRADAVLTANAAGDTSTNFQPTYEAIEAVRRAVTPFAGLSPDETPVEDGGERIAAVAQAAGPEPGGRMGGGRIESREDVVKALDAIADYYRAREPSSPVPVLLSRARAWVGLDFIGLLDDLLPDSLGEARRVLNTKADRDASNGY